MQILSPVGKHGMWTSNGKGIWRYDFQSQPHLRLMGVTDILLCFPDHSPHLSNLLSARRLTSANFLASGLQLGLLEREHQQQISRMEKKEAEVFVPLAFPLWCHKGVAVPLHKGLSYFQMAPSVHLCLSLCSANSFMPSDLDVVTAPLLIALGFCTTSYDFSLHHVQIFVDMSTLP